MLKKYWEKLDKNYLWLFVLSLFILSPFISYFYVEGGHDTYYHVANILALSKNFSIFHLFDFKVFPILANQFGYGSGIFYPQFSHIVASLFVPLLNLFSFNVVYAMKITHFLALWLSGIFMYQFVKLTLKDKKVALLAAVFYETFPYHVIETMTRDAFGEIFVFPFLPMILIGVYYLFQKKWFSFYLYFGIGYIFLIQSHLVLAMYLTFFIGAVLLLNYRKFFQKDVIKHFMIVTLIVTFVSLPFLTSMLEHKFLGDYAVFRDGFMTNPDRIRWYAVWLYEFFIPTQRVEDRMTFYIPLFLILLFVFFCFHYKKASLKENRWVFKMAIFFVVSSFFLISNFCPWAIFPNFLKMIQFPWRLEIILCFGLSITCAYALRLFPKNYQDLLFYLCIFLSLCTVTQILSKTKFSELDLNQIDISMAGLGGNEYLPWNTVENFSYMENRSQDVLLRLGYGEIQLESNEFPNLEFDVKNVYHAKLEIPRIYYLGYQIEAIHENQVEKVHYYENENGFIEFDLDHDAHIRVTYPGTLFDQISKWIAIVTLFSFFIYLVFCYNREKRCLD